MSAGGLHLCPSPERAHCAHSPTLPRDLASFVIAVGFSQWTKITKVTTDVEGDAAITLRGVSGTRLTAWAAEASLDLDPGLAFGPPHRRARQQLLRATATPRPPCTFASQRLARITHTERESVCVC